MHGRLGMPHNAAFHQPHTVTRSEHGPAERQERPDYPAGVRERGEEGGDWGTETLMPTVPSTVKYSTCMLLNGYTKILFFLETSVLNFPFALELSA